MTLDACRIAARPPFVLGEAGYGQIEASGELGAEAHLARMHGATHAREYVERRVAVAHHELDERGGGHGGRCGACAAMMRR